MKRILATLALAAVACAASTAAAQSISAEIVPQFIQGNSATNNDRIPFAFRLQITGLTPSATYRYFNQVVVGTDTATANGAGNVIFANQIGNFTRSTGPSMSSAGNFAEFTTDGSGNYAGWFVTEPTGNTRFTPGNTVFFRLMLNDGAGGTTVVTRLTTTDSAQVINWGAAGPNTGTGVRGTNAAYLVPKNMAFLYDNTAGTGRPIAGSLIESDGLDVPDANFVDFHDTAVDGVAGAFGTIVPNALANGIRRVEQRSLSTGAVVSSYTSTDGTWAGAGNTVNPSGGSATPIVFSAAPDLPVSISGFSID